MEDYFQIGVVAGTHGLKGTLRIFPTTDDIKRFELLKEILIEKNQKKESFTIDKISYHKQFVLVTVKEINDINLAEQYKGSSILIPESQALPLEEDEYYTKDLYGLDVYTKQGEFLGNLSEVYVTGANDVYGIQKENEKELLIPAIKQCILEIDFINQKMIVNLLEGLRE